MSISHMRYIITLLIRLPYIWNFVKENFSCCHTVNLILPFSRLAADWNTFELSDWMLGVPFSCCLWGCTSGRWCFSGAIYFLPVSFNRYLFEDICLLLSNAQKPAYDFAGFQYTFAAKWKMSDGMMQGVEAQTLANVYLALENNLEIIPVSSRIQFPFSSAQTASNFEFYKCVSFIAKSLYIWFLPELLRC